MASLTNPGALAMTGPQQIQILAPVQYTLEFNHQTFQGWIDTLVDHDSSEEIKLKSIQDLSLNLELMQTLPTYSQLIDDAMHKFMRVLNETEPQFITESTTQQLRKKILEIIQRTTSILNSYYLNSDQRSLLIREILLVVYRLVEKENEENVIICLKIITDYHRQPKSVMNNEVQQFFNFVKSIYRELPRNMSTVFNYKPQIKLLDINEVNLDNVLSETYSSFQITSEKPNTKETQTYNVLPRGCMSLKVLAECLLTTVMMYQYNKNYLNQEISEIIPMVANVIALQPSDEQRLCPDNKEIYTDFVTAQLKALSFLAFFKSHKDCLVNNSELVVSGIMQLLKNCPPEVVSVRKELLAISRHIISDLRTNFLPYIGQFFDETTFCGTGYTASESLRTSACSIVADYVHNVRKQLSYNDIQKAITYFSKSLHDPLLHINLQHMCCRVLLNLIDCIKQKDQENLQARDLILKLFQVVVLKFKTIAKYQVPYLLLQNNNNTTQSDKKSPTTDDVLLVAATTELKLDTFLNSFEDKDRVKLKYGPSSVIILSETDCRSAIKFLILACRSITGFMIDTKLPAAEASRAIQLKQLTSRETIVFIKFLKNALLCLDVYMIGRNNKTNNSAKTSATLETQKEEKEVIENLGVIFSYLNPLSLKEIFLQTIDFIIERTFKNANIYILSSYFLATPATSCTFATILIEYLLKKMKFMGDSDLERSNLYLKLFKLVFGSVSVLAAENEKMLKPHLHSLVTRSLELALKAKQPYNYFLLLRALFRSIGGGNHDLLYQEFLPLLPVLLQNLNELQTGLHKQYLKDLFVELCLTVPVRLSSLLPYLPMLMDPLVSALNGSTTLISQGLRTLELCVDNLQADFLYDHIQPVQTDLIQGLWRTLQSSNDSIAHVAYRVLGKLGGTNRKMLIEPQKLKYNQNSNNCKEFNGPTIKVSFPNYAANIEVSLEKVLESCLLILKSSDQDLFYKKHAFKIVSSFLATLINPETDQSTTYNFFNKFNPLENKIFSEKLLKSHRFEDKHLRDMVQTAFKCVFLATSSSQIKTQVYALLDSLVTHFTLISLAHYNNSNTQQIIEQLDSNVFSHSAQLQSPSKPSNTSSTSPSSRLAATKSQMTSSLNSNAINQFHLAQLNNCLDFMILVDVLYSVLTNDDSEHWPVIQRAVLIMIEVSEIVSYPSDETDKQDTDNIENESVLFRDEQIMAKNFANLALFDYLGEKLSNLCYERSWYAKKSACCIIKLLCKKMPLVWILSKAYLFIHSIMAVLVSVSGEISSGAIDVAEELLEILIRISLIKINIPSDDATSFAAELVDLQQRTVDELLKELIRQITSSNVYVRNQCTKLIKLVAELRKLSIYATVQPHAEVLLETVAPRKHLKLRHYPAQSQIGILDGIEFCSSTQPQLFVLNMSNPDHQNLFQELVPICEGDEAQLAKNACYKNLADLTPLRKVALNTLASFYHLLEQRELILSTLHRALASPNEEIQQTSFACLKKYISNTELYSTTLAKNSAPSPTATSTSVGSECQPAPPTPNPIIENLRQTMQIAADYLKDYLNPLTEHTSLNLNVMQHLSYITQLYPTILNEKFSDYLLAHLRSWLESLSDTFNENAATSAAFITANTTPNNPSISLTHLQTQLKPVATELKLCAAILSLLAELQSAPSKLVEPLISLVLRFERPFQLEVNTVFRGPLSRFLKRYPFETLKFLLHSDRIRDMYIYRFLVYLIKTQPAFALIFRNEPKRLVQMLNESQTLLATAQQAVVLQGNLSAADLVTKSNQSQFLTILIVYRLAKQDLSGEWIVGQAQLVECLLRIWCSDRFHEKHRTTDQLDYIYWKEPVYLIKIFLKFHKAQMEISGKSLSTSVYPTEMSIELLFKLLIVFQYKSLLQYEFLRLFFKDVVAKSYSCEWKREAFFKFVKVFNEQNGEKKEAPDDKPSTPSSSNPPVESNDTPSTDNTQNTTIPPTTAASSTSPPTTVNSFTYTDRMKANILQYILIPCFQYCFEQNQHVQLIGGPPQPELDTDQNIISVFVNKVIDPDTTNTLTTDSVRIFLLQLSSLFVQYAHDYIHDVNNKKQGTKLRRLMTFAWPCLLAKTCVDPFNKYHGHLLLSHIISKFAIHKRIVLQVFHSLLKAHAPEAKVVVRQALEILTPSFPTRMDDGYLTLASWTKKILIEENHTVPQLAHMLYIIVKYHRVYYLIRHSLINHVITSFQKVGLSANSTPENRQLAIDLTEVILRWEAQRLREQQQQQLEDPAVASLLAKHPDMLKPFDKNVASCLLNFFIRTACPAIDSHSQHQQQQQQQQQNLAQNEALSKRCLSLFQTAVANNIWSQSDIKFDYLDKILISLESVNNLTNLINNTNVSGIQQSPGGSTANQPQTPPNYSSICICLELVTFLVEHSGESKSKVQQIFRTLQRGITAALMSTNSRVITSVSALIKTLMPLMPADFLNNNPATTNTAETTSPMTTGESAASTTPTSTATTDPIYSLFGQPDGVLCKAILDSLAFYDKSSLISSLAPDNNNSATPSFSTAIEILTNCLHMLKSAANSNPQYIDRIMGPFMKILQKLYRDHLNATGAMGTGSGQVSATSTSPENSNYMTGPNSITVNAFSELLIQFLDLIKYRVGVMSLEMRKLFINSILVTLIDKCVDLRVIRYLVRLINDWIRYKTGPLLNQIPTAKEKMILLQRLTLSMEKRFAEHADLQQSFLEMIAYVYKEESNASNSEFKIKLEQAFLCGLKSPNPQIRQTFFEIFNSNFNSADLYDRLCYIIVTQNWEALGTHYWIKQCIQMTLGSCASAHTPVQYSDIAAHRFKLYSFTEAAYSAANTGQSSGGQQQGPVNESTESANTTIMMNIDTNLDDLNLWSADFGLNTPLADIPDVQDKPETTVQAQTSFADVQLNLNKKLMNIYKEIKTESSSEEPEAMNIDNETVSEPPLVSSRRSQLLQVLISNQFQLFKFCSNIKSSELIVPLCQLCHLDSDLAHQIWIQLFIQMFNLLNPKQQQNLYGELTPFVASGSHCVQKQSQLSTINTFIESFAMAKPVSLFLRPSLLAYLAKNHNLWHRVILLLENSLYTTSEMGLSQIDGVTGTASGKSFELAGQAGGASGNQQQQQQNALQNVQHETFSSLSHLYQQLKEEDYRAGLWHKRAMQENTKVALMYEQQGLFYQAQKLYEEIISRAGDVYVNEPNLSNSDELLEFNLWEERWINCCKELNQWTELGEYAQAKDNDFGLSLECSWKQPTNDWQQMKSLLITQKDSSLPRSQSWRLSLYQGFFIVCNPDDYQNLMQMSNPSNNSSSMFSPSSAVESKIDRCMHLTLKEWRRLPRLVSPAHMNLLQAAQQIVELQEAFQIQNNLAQLSQQQQASTNTATTNQAILQEIKAIIKTWRARLPLISDNISYWNDIFTWRQYHYESFTRFYDNQAGVAGSVGGTNPMAMLGVHALAQGIVHFGKVARKQHLYDLCLETLNKIHKKQTVPVIDCFFKVKQEIKCYINTFEYLTSKQAQELLEVIEATNLRYFTKENVAELISLKAHFLQLCGKYDDANHLYSFSIYLNDSQARLWGTWGDYLAQAFVNVCSRASEPTGFSRRSIETAESALIALLNAARYPNSECKARKFIAKILWLLTYDNEKRQLFTTFDLYSNLIPAGNWINWIPQLITLLIRNDDTGKYVTNLMNQIVRQYPLALYYPLRTLYLKLKNDEQTEKLKHQFQQQLLMQQQQKQSQGNDVEMKEAIATTTTVKPTPFTASNTAAESLIRVTTLMHRQREQHPTLFNTLEGLIDQLLWLKVNWYEESLRNFKQTLFACYTLAYEHINTINTSVFKNPKAQQQTQQQQPIHEYSIDPFTIIWFKRLHKFYAESYLDKFQLARNLFSTNNNNNNSSTPITPGTPTIPSASANNLNNIANSQNQRVRSLLAVLNDPNYLITRTKFQQDFNFQLPTASVNVFVMIAKLKAWIKLFELHLRTMPKSQLLDERFKFVTQFCSSTADIEIPGEFLIPRHTNYYVKINKFLPRVESVEKYNAYSRRISIRGHNGKVYPFLISNEANYYECRREEHIIQLLRMVNTYLGKQKETASRSVHFTLPRIVSWSAEVRIVEDDCSSISLLDIYKNTMHKLSVLKSAANTQQQVSGGGGSGALKGELGQQQKILLMSEAGDLPLARYFERIQMASASLAAVSSSTTLGDSSNNKTHTPTINKQYFIDLFKYITNNLLPKSVLKEWAAYTYSDATDYFHFRKLFTSQFAIYGLLEYVCHLTRLNPDQLYISQNTGVCQTIRLKFDLNEQLPHVSAFNADRSVPYRLTPNIAEFITNAGINGLYNSIQVAQARCLVQPQYHFSWILRAILKDEVLTCIGRKKQEESMRSTSNLNLNSTTSVQQLELEAEALISTVNKLAGQIDERLKECAALEGGKNFVTNELIPRATNVENLSQMDPLWYPWL